MATIAVCAAWAVVDTMPTKATSAASQQQPDGGVGMPGGAPRKEGAGPGKTPGAGPAKGAGAKGAG